MEEDTRNFLMVLKAVLAFAISLLNTFITREVTVFVRYVARPISAGQLSFITSELARWRKESAVAELLGSGLLGPR